MSMAEVENVGQANQLKNASMKTNFLNAIHVIFAKARLYPGMNSTDWVMRSHISAEARRERMLYIKNASKKILQTVNLRDDIESKIKGRVFDLSENLRYLSPTPNPDAHLAEEKILKELNLLESMLQNSPHEFTEELVNSIQACTLYYQERKSA